MHTGLKDSMVTACPVMAPEQDPVETRGRVSNLGPMLMNEPFPGVLLSTAA